MLIVNVAFSQQQKISGKITDVSGTPQEGVSVKIKSGSAGALTNKEGFFSIDANTNDVLEISAVGFTPQAIKVNGRSEINIQLEASIAELGQIVLVGTRSSGRIRTETPVPIDVVNLTQTEHTTAKPDLTSLLNISAPSFNYNKQSGGDGADAIDLATLRGLGPDQTLVLINGKRQHQTAFVALFGTRGRGNSGTDLNAIPEAAIDRVEILRDGASAQYGSDAIAGVINIILKKNVNHLSVDLGYSGYYDHKYNSLNSVDPNQYVTANQFDGVAKTVGINYGFSVGKQNGFINFSGNFLMQDKTFRQVSDTNITTNPLALPINNVRRANGDASVTSGGGMFNMELPFANNKSSFYAFGAYNYKNSNAYAYSRNFSGHPERFPTDANGNLIFVPGIMHYTDPKNPSNGDVFYNPVEDVHITDASLALGFKGTSASNWDWDVSNVIGENNFHYYGDQTFNASLGAAGANKNHFDDGGFYFLQNTLNANLSKHYSSIAEGLNVAFGAEFRYEQYGIYKGEEGSYTNYDETKATGAQGFPGFQPADEVTAHRINLGAYTDLELDITKRWLIDVAVRFENYNDFGFLSTSKFATRYKLTHNFNVRGSLSTGYRAPSLQQINFSNTVSNVVAGVPSLVKYAPNYSPLTQAAGIPNLKQENSVNGSIGFSWIPARGLTITLDGYIVQIKDRVVLSGSFQATDTTLNPALTSILQQLHVNSAQFFANAVNTTNTGLDLIIDYNKRWYRNGFKLLFAGNLQHMTIDKINVPEKLNDTYLHQQTFFSGREQQFVLASAPPAKLSLNLEYNINKFGIGTHFTYYGKIKLLGYGYTGSLAGTGINPMVNLGAFADGPLVPEQFIYHGKIVTDIFAAYHFSKNASLFIGADNLFNVHPDLGIVPGANGSAFDGETGGPWDAVQMGFNGLRLFAKLSLNF